MKIACLVSLFFSSFFAIGQNEYNQTEFALSVDTMIEQDSAIGLDKNGSSIHDFHIKYELGEPTEIFELPDVLQEISALGFDSDFQKLYAVQDENGLVFIIDKKSGEVEKEIDFHKDGDYEGIEVVGDIVYVVKSTGTIYEIKNLGNDDQQMEKYNLFLSRENDVEGLCFDPATNKLLMACKGVPATGESFDIIRYKKVVYGFDIATKEIDSLPVYTIMLDGIQKCLHTSKTIKNTDALKANFSGEEKDINFNPSGIAIHPDSKNVYILSSSGKTLIVLNNSGEVIYIEKLDKKVHRQPEGIAFDKDGTLYISNEGSDKKTAKIYKFDYKK